MITLIDKKDGSRTIYESQGELSFFIVSPQQINMDIKVLRPEGGLGINSEWLGFKTDSSTRIHWPKFQDLEIKEQGHLDLAPISFHGSYADELDSGENWAFYYYVRQALQPVQSWTRLRYQKENQFRLQHKSNIQLYELEIDATVAFTGLGMHIWKDPTMASPAENVLLDVFQKKFDSTEYGGPVITDNERIKSIHFPPKF